MRAFSISPCQASTSGRGSCQQRAASSDRLGGAPKAACQQIPSCRRTRSSSYARPSASHLKVDGSSRNAVIMAAASVDSEPGVKRRGRPRKDAPPSLDVDESPEVVEEGAPGLPKVRSMTPPRSPSHHGAMRCEVADPSSHAVFSLCSPASSNRL